MKTRQQAGFTLVELAIVMMIIGLLIGGILKGQELMENARVTSTIAQTQAYDSATTTFRDMYNGYPGDIRTATDRVPGCNGNGGCGNGNGNNIIGSATGLEADQSAIGTEPTLYWNHLVLADLISGVLPDPTTATTPVAWDVSHPTAKLGGGFQIGFNDGTALANGGGNPAGHFLILKSIVDAAPTTASGTGVLSPNRAAQIDRKLDDGNPDEGTVIGHGTANCYGNDDYTETVTSKDCNLFIRVQR